jgi:predicted transposase/invertase (TIGR01784 family)
MHESDAILKSILTRLAGSVLIELTGFAVERWHNTELPAVRHRRADLLGETSSGRLVHIELQSTNQAHMPLRMLEYALAIHRKFHRFPEQIVLYVGNAPLRTRAH